MAMEGYIKLTAETLEDGTPQISGDTKMKIARGIKGTIEKTMLLTAFMQSLDMDKDELMACVTLFDFVDGNRITFKADRKKKKEEEEDIEYLLRKLFSEESKDEDDS